MTHRGAFSAGDDKTINALEVRQLQAQIGGLAGVRGRYIRLAPVCEGKGVAILHQTAPRGRKARKGGEQDGGGEGEQGKKGQRWREMKWVGQGGRNGEGEGGRVR
eukprot:scaffold167578_cov28-Tisochrysis_lutea.AAC.2